MPTETPQLLNAPAEYDVPRQRILEEKKVSGTVFSGVCKRACSSLVSSSRTDKELYDALLARDIDRLRASICTPHASLEASLRFLKNHDETRAAACFSDDQQEAAMLAITTLPGATLLHQGQTEGYRVRIPGALRRRRHEPGNQRLR